MKYINALELINLCIKSNILKEKDGGVFVQTNKTPGWSLMDKDILAKKLMNDKKGQDIIIDKLKEKNIEIKLSDY